MCRLRNRKDRTIDYRKPPNDKINRNYSNVLALALIILRLVINFNNSKKDEAPIQQKKNGPFGDPIVWATVGIFIATGASVGVAFLQWTTLEKTDETLREAQRAFVFVKVSPRPWTPAYVNGADIVRTYSIEWENSGNSQTKNLIVKLYCPESSWFEDKDPTKNNPPTITAPRLLGPKQSIWGGVCNYKATALDLVRINKKKLYVAAVATYSDIFDKPHITRHCQEITNIQGDFFDINVTPANDLTLCGRNCADDECKADD